MAIYKYLIECLDEQCVKTYSFEAENFTVLKLHGGEYYKLNSFNIAEYWRQWKQETGHTSEDSTDICIVWRNGQNVEKIFSTGKQADIQTVSPTTWTSEDIEKFFSSTARQLKSKWKNPFDNIIRVETAQGKKFLVGTLDKPYHSLSQKPSVKNPPEPEKTEPPARKKISATSIDIAMAWKELSQKHNTT